VAQHYRFTTKAFTLIELVTVIAITTILSGFFLAYSSSSRDQVAISTETAKVAQTIARAKSLALSTYNRTPQPCGYGVSFDYDAQTYSVFGYVDTANGCRTINATGITDTWGGDPGKVRVDPVGETAAKTLLLDKDAAGAVYGVLFVAPDPKVYLIQSGGSILAGNGLVHIQSKSGSFSNNVTISAGGQIDF